MVHITRRVGPFEWRCSKLEKSWNLWIEMIEVETMKISLFFYSDVSVFFKKKKYLDRKKRSCLKIVQNVEKYISTFCSIASSSFFLVYQLHKPGWFIIFLGCNLVAVG